MNLKDVQYKDQLKIKICKEHGVKLIVIPWTVLKKGNIVTLKEYLKEELIKLGIKIPKNFNKVEVTVPEVYKNNDIDEIKNLLAKDNFTLYTYETIPGGRKYTIKCPNGHYSRRSGHEIKYKTCSLCKRCLLQSKGYKITPPITPTYYSLVLIYSRTV